MVYQVDVTSSAKRDLAEIYAWAFGDSLEVKALWLDELQNAVLSLSHQPLRCPLAPGTFQAIRVLLSGRRPHVYRILYRVDEKKSLVQVIHIRHASRQDLKLK